MKEPAPGYDKIKQGCKGLVKETLLLEIGLGGE
jgi:hypothetical protein